MVLPRGLVLKGPLSFSLTLLESSVVVVSGVIVNDSDVYRCITDDS